MMRYGFCIKSRGYFSLVLHTINVVDHQRICWKSSKPIQSTALKSLIFDPPCTANKQNINADKSMFVFNQNKQ